MDELVRQHLRRQKGLVQRRMAEREKIYSDFQEKLWKHMEEQNKLLRDNVERRKRDSRPLSRPLSSVSKRDSRPISLISNSEEDQLDQERILESYGAILDTMDSEEEDEDEEVALNVFIHHGAKLLVHAMNIISLRVVLLMKTISCCNKLCHQIKQLPLMNHLKYDWH